MKLTEEYIRETLLKLGFSPANAGFGYIIEAMQIIDLNPNAAYNVGKQIYIPIAKNHGCSISVVESNIRRSVKSSMKIFPDRLVDYLKYPPTAVSGSYKNADFLAAFHMALHRG